MTETKETKSCPSSQRETTVSSGSVLWRCSACGLDNPSFVLQCEMCCDTKPSHDDTPDGAEVKSWICKLCSMANNAHLPYCESCLVSREVQENDMLFKGLQAELKSDECDDHIKADEIQTLIEKLKSDIQRLQNHDTAIIGEIQHQIDDLYPDFVKEFMEAFGGGQHDAFKDQRKYNRHCHPVCKCGTMMDSVKAKKCYNPREYSCVICDICNQKVALKSHTFHCPRHKVADVHPDGFDICLPCRKRNIHRLRYFVAILICPNMVRGQKNQDAEALTAMFKKL